MTRARVGQLLVAGSRSEGLFLGTGKLTLALGGKLEADKPEPGPAVSQEGFQAYGRLCELARTLGLDAHYEVIPPPDLVNLNRDNLVVVCGPRLSPVIAQVLASDPNLGFAHDDHGWYLQDPATGTTYRSPMDDGKPADYAYLGRLPRIDGRGSFLHFAGIHPPATAAPPTTSKGTWRSCTARSAPGASRPSSPAASTPAPARSPAAGGSPRCTGQTPGPDARRRRHLGGQPGRRHEDWAGVLAPGLAVVLDGLSAPDGDRHRLSPRHALVRRPARPTTADPGKRPHPQPGRRAGRGDPAGCRPASGLRPDHPGTPSAAVTGSLAGKDLHRAVLLSDGASRLVDLFELATWEELLALLDASGPDELLRQVRAAQAVDPQGRQ